MALSQDFHSRAREIIAQYPSSRSALIPLLHLAQEETAFLTADVMREVASVLGLSNADVASVATFYTMFKFENPGKFLISLCTNVGCAIWGANDTARRLEKVVGPPHKATEDGLMSWEPVECLATCDIAPAAQLNYRDVPQLTPERAEKLIDALKSGRSAEEILDEFRAAGPVRSAEHASAAEHPNA